MRRKSLVEVVLVLLVGCAEVAHVPPAISPAIPTGVSSSEWTGAPTGKATVKSPVVPVPATPPAALPQSKGASPTLDLTALEARLRGTTAIGVFTKIALKNQVDDLLEQFREHYSGRVKTSLVALRQPYDRLLLKVLTLLQDGDPELARAVVASREPMWNFLADPARFATL